MKLLLKVTCNELIIVIYIYIIYIYKKPNMLSVQPCDHLTHGYDTH